MNNFEKIYVDGVPTEKHIKIENDGLRLNKLTEEDIILRDFLCSSPSFIDPDYPVPVIDLREKEPEKPIAEPKNNSGRAIKKSAKRSNKV